MLSEEKKMEVLEAFDLTNCYRTAAQLTGVDHHTVANLVASRAAGTLGATPEPRAMLSDTFADKIEQWVNKSSAKIRADVVHDRLVAMGYGGSERTTRRVVAHAKAAWRRKTHRIYKPWITEPGAWLQWDYGEGPVIAGRRTILFCAWMAWSRFRVIIPLADRSWPSVVAALDQTFRLIGGVPTYLLTDNEKTVTDHHIAGIAVRNRAAVDLSRYYGVSIVTCVPYDPESKGGSERTVGIAKADLVPTEYNLLEHYTDFSEFSRACSALSHSFNNRVHSVTRQIPAGALEIERGFLHPVPDAPYSVAFGESRCVGWSSTVSYRGSRYSVPDTLAGSKVWVRIYNDEVVIVSVEGSVTSDVARHRLLGAGQASIVDAHYRDRPLSPLQRQPKANRVSEADFLALGEGAKLYLIEAAATGAARIKTRMAEAVNLACLHEPDVVDGALGIAAMAGRFCAGDLESILVHQAGGVITSNIAPQEHSLAQGTQMWSALGAAMPTFSAEYQEGEL